MHHVTNSGILMQPLCHLITPSPMPLTLLQHRTEKTTEKRKKIFTIHYPIIKTDELPQSMLLFGRFHLWRWCFLNLHLNPRTIMFHNHHGRIGLRSRSRSRSRSRNRRPLPRPMLLPTDPGLSTAGLRVWIPRSITADTSSLVDLWEYCP